MNNPTPYPIFQFPQYDSIVFKASKPTPSRIHLYPVESKQDASCTTLSSSHIPNSIPFKMSKNQIWKPSHHLNNSLNIMQWPPNAGFQQPLETCSFQESPSNQKTFISTTLAAGCLGIIEISNFLDPYTQLTTHSISPFWIVSPKQLQSYLDFLAPYSSRSPSEIVGSKYESSLQSCYIQCHAWSTDSKILVLATERSIFVFMNISPKAPKYHFIWHTFLLSKPCSISVALGHIPYSRNLHLTQYTNSNNSQWKYRIAVATTIGIELIYFTISKDPMNIFKCFPVGKWIRDIDHGAQCLKYSPSGDLIAVTACESLALFWSHPYSSDSNLGFSQSSSMLWSKQPKFPEITTFLNLSSSSTATQQIDNCPLKVRKYTFPKIQNQSLPPTTSDNEFYSFHKLENIQRVTDLNFDSREKHLLIAGWKGHVHILKRSSLLIFSQQTNLRLAPLTGTWEPFQPRSGLIPLGVPSGFTKPGSFPIWLGNYYCALSIPSRKCVHILEVENGNRIDSHLAHYDSSLDHQSEYQPKAFKVEIDPNAKESHHILHLLQNNQVSGIASMSRTQAYYEDFPSICGMGSVSSGKSHTVVLFTFKGFVLIPFNEPNKVRIEF